MWHDLCEFIKTHEQVFTVVWLWIARESIVVWKWLPGAFSRTWIWIGEQGGVDGIKKYIKLGKQQKENEKTIVSVITSS